MSRNIRKILIGLFVIAAMLLPASPALAAAGDAVAANKWLINIPELEDMDVTDEDVDPVRALPVRGGGQSLKRNQRAYFIVSDTGGTERLVQNTGSGATGYEAVDCTPASTCTSAPLFIASTSAIICMTPDMSDTVQAVTAKVTVNLCADSTCTDAKSINHLAVLAHHADFNTYCGEGGALDGADASDIGGQWIFVDYSTNGVNDDDLLVWVVGM